MVSSRSAKKSPKSRAEAREQSREALIAAGIALFAEQGLDAPSLDAICERAGYTRGAFYVHFEDRDDFLVAVMERVGERYLELVMPSAAVASPDLASTVQRFVASLAAGAYPLSSPSGIKPHQLLDACARSPKIKARYLSLVGDTLKRLGRAVHESQEHALVRRDVGSEHVALLLLTGVIGLHTLLELGLPVEVPAVAAATVALLAPGAAT